MKLFAILVGYGAVMAAAYATPPPDTVVLLHGLGRTSFSMTRLACELEHAGYRVINTTYPSLRRSVETVATEWLPAQLSRVEADSRVHFVTHSMGGIVLRQWLRECGAPKNLGRVVMLAPPNAGSEIVDRLAGCGPLQWLTGVNGHRLGTAPEALPRALGAWSQPSPARGGALGIIAGTHSFNPLTAAWLPAPNDGKVSVASTHLAGERDHVVLPYSHTWLGWRRETVAQVLVFLRTGRFAQPDL